MKPETTPCGLLQIERLRPSTFVLPDHGLDFDHTDEKDTE